MTDQEAFDEYVRREVSRWISAVRRNHDAWAAIHDARERMGKLSFLFWRHPIPPPPPAPLPRDVQVRAIQLGIL
jgi:ferric-dicitrate binding protein FerR (iron transport regulator)